MLPKFEQFIRERQLPSQRHRFNRLLAYTQPEVVAVRISK